jgi:hypothetical protein
MEEINLKKLIAEAREIAESLDEFADKLERIEKIEKKYVESDKKHTELSTPDDPDWGDFIIAEHMHAKYSNNGFPHFMEELTEDDLDVREKTIWTNPRTDDLDESEE